MNAYELKVLKELVENMEENDKEGIEEHDFHTDHDADQCVLCSARELLRKYEEETEKKAKRKTDILYRGFSSDGLIMLTLKGIDYTFRVDSARIPDWVKTLTGKRPGGAVKKIRETCHWYRNDTTGEMVIHVGKKTYYTTNKVTENTERG